jgi:hypothetical protein
MTEDAPQRVYPLRDIFNALRYLVRVGGAWRMLPHDLPSWSVVYQQTQRSYAWKLSGVTAAGICSFLIIASSTLPILTCHLTTNPDKSTVTSSWKNKCH